MEETRARRRQSVPARKVLLLACCVVPAVLALALPPLAGAIVDFNRVDSSGPYRGYTRDVAVAELNADSAPDVVVPSMDFRGGAVHVYPGAGVGPLRDLTILPAGFGMSEVAIADFDNDELPDVAAVDESSWETGQVFWIWLNQGELRFNLAWTGSFDWDQSTMAVGDLNEDGHADLVVSGDDQSDPFDQISVLLGNGDGSFSGPLHFPISRRPPAGGIALGDLNEDGHLDVVARVRPDIGDETITSFLGQGDGNLEEGFGVAAGIEWPRKLSLADVNLDGSLDLATGDLYGGPWLALGRGDGSFYEVRQFDGPHEGGTLDVELTDLNGDAAPDLIAADGGYAADGSNQISVRMNKGAGGFGPATIYAVRSQARSIAGADLNLDGKQDLAMSDGWGAAVLLQGDGVPVCKHKGVTALGSDGVDKLFLGRRRDTAVMRRSADTLATGSGADLACAGRGDDRVLGKKGNDRLRGGPGADLIKGGPGDDLLVGGRGRDKCIGGPGVDALRGC